MTTNISRVVEGDRSSKLDAMTMAVYSVPRLIEKVDALATFPGMGEWWRVIDAIRWWQEKKPLHVIC